MRALGRALVVAVVLPVALVLSTAPGRADDTLTVQEHRTALAILSRQPVREGAFAACLFRLYAQGLGIVRAQHECEVALPGLAGAAGTPLPAGHVSASSGVGLRCPGTLNGPAARGQAYGRPYADPRAISEDLGGYSWGGSGEVKSADEWFVWRGLSETESARRKAEAVDRYFDAVGDAQRAFDDWTAAVDAANNAHQSGDPQAIKAADEKQRQASAALDDAQTARDIALHNAQADPNKAPPDVSDVDPEAATCGADALAFLVECDRADWRTPDCRELQARMHHCVDPALIYPDPLDGSIACGESLADPEQVASALEAWCHERVRYGPDVDDPCSIHPRQGAPDSEEMALRGYVWDAGSAAVTVCGSPLAYVSQDSCVVPLRLPDFGQTSLDEVLLWAIDKLGGPVVILPADPRTSGPRPPLDPPRPGI